MAAPTNPTHIPSSKKNPDEISSLLIRAESESLDEAIECVLGALCAHEDAARGSLFCLCGDAETFTHTHEWCRAPKDSDRAVPKTLPLESFGPYRSDLLAGRNVTVSRPSASPPKIDGRESSPTPAGRPFALFPLFVRDKMTAIVGLYGDIGIEKKWRDDTADVIGKVRDALINAVLRIRSEAALRESEQRHRIVSELATDYWFRLAVAKDGKVTMDHITDNYYTITGRTRDDVVTVESWSSIILPEDMEKVMTLLKKLVEGPHHAIIECRSFILRSDHQNSLRWVEINTKSEWDERENRVTSIVGAVKDITDRRRAEESFRLRESYLTAIIENQPGLMWLKDAKGRFLTVNRAFARSCGKSHPEDLVGKTDPDVWPENLASQYREDDEAVMRNGSPVSVEELILDKGESRWFETFKTPVKNSEGTIIGTTGYAHDITARKQQEEALRNVQKLESLGVLAGGIAHDFNNLLGGIFGYIDLAAETTSEKAVQDMLGRALATIDRARGLTQQLLTFAKGGAPIKTTESLISFIPETVRFALSGSRVSCDFHIPKDLWLCEFDKNQISQVIDNLVINAQQAMPDGGTIDITAENLSIKEKSHAVLKPGNYVKVSVIDRGIGMPQDILPRIFDPFFTTKSKGHGLGLATCYSIVHRHGGLIEVESAPGKGSAFHFYLQADPTVGKASSKSTPPPYKSSGTIIVMDDEEVIRDTVGNMLKSLGYLVICTQDGKEAIEVLQKEWAANRRIEAMILDLTVRGGLGGRDAVKEIRKIDSKLPVFVASGYADDPVMAAPKEHGFTDSICKPFRRVDLADMLRRNILSE